MNIYKHSHFLANPFGHGGEKRTAQINQLLKKAGINYNEAGFSEFAPPAKSYSSYFTGLKYTKKITGLKNNYAIGRYIKQFNKFIKNTKPSLFIWESTVEYNLLLAPALHKNSIPFIALPHNLESLVNNSRSVFSNKKSPAWFDEELEYLSYSNKVFTISREEQWLLSLYDVDAGYLPYYPTDGLKEELLLIREKRIVKEKQNPIKQILLLGTFHNTPTRNGYINLVSNIKYLKNIQINIAGYGSEALKNLFNDDNIKIYGSVSNDVLKALMINADLCVIEQEPTTGALTRIPELLIAGIPILADSSAARSYYDYKGITVYNNYDELTGMLSSPLSEIPPIPLPPVEEELFTGYIKKTYLQP